MADSDSAACQDGTLELIAVDGVGGRAIREHWVSKVGRGTWRREHDALMFNLSISQLRLQLRDSRIMPLDTRVKLQKFATLLAINSHRCSIGLPRRACTRIPYFRKALSELGF